MNGVWQCIIALVCTMLLPVYISDSSIAFSNSIFSVFFFTAILVLMVNAAKYGYHGRKKKYTRVLGLIFSGFTACGFALDRGGNVPYTNILFWISVVLYTHVYSIALCLLWSFLERVEKLLETDNKAEKDGRWYYTLLALLIHKPLICILLFLMCWFPCYLSIFPGNFVFDATKEYNQVIQGYSGDFPLLHSALLTKTMFAMYQLTNSYNAGIAVFVIGQMILLAALFWNILKTFYEDGVNRKVLWLLLGYYTLFPVIHLLVTTSVRDVMFSGLVVYSMLMTYRMFRNRVEFFEKRINPIYSSIVFTLTVLSRNNNAGKLGMGIVLLYSVFFWLLFRKKNEKGARTLLIVPICSYILLGGVLTAICQPLVPAAKGSSLSVMTQPIARAYSMNVDRWSEEEVQEFEEYFFVNGMQYVDVNADMTKYRFKEEADMTSFLKFWLKIGLKYPDCYADAILANTRQMWFPDSVIDGYVKVGAYTEDKSYFYFAKYIEPPGTYEGKLSPVLDFYQKIALYISFERIPVISMLFSIGFMVWMVLNCCAYVIYRKATDLYCSLGIILLYVACSAFVPLVLLRYFAALYFAFPFTIVYTLQPVIANKLLLEST